MSEQCVASHDELYRAHRAQLVRLAASYLHDQAAAEDVVHEVFTAFLTVELRDPDAAASYLWRSTMNRSVSALRKQAHLAGYEPPDVAADPPIEQLVAEGGDRSIVLEGLKGLTDRQRTVLYLHYYADMAMADIAATLGVSVGTVKSHAFRGRGRLAARAAAARAPQPIPQSTASPCRCSTAPTGPEPSASKTLTHVQRAKSSQALTSVEVDILHRLASGAYDDQIARALAISTRTVRRHLAAVQRKLGALSRPHAVALAIQMDVLKREDPDAAAAAEVPATTAQTPTT